MGDLSKNLSRHEFACKCGCGFDTADVDTVDAIQGAADYFSIKFDSEIWVDITGPNRCYQHNKDEGGAPDSQHLYGRAVDHKFFLKRENKKGEQVEPEDVAKFYEESYPAVSIGRYSNRTHMDTRTNGPAGWRD